MNEAYVFLMEVKDVFQDEMEKYDEFLELLKDFKAQRIDTGAVKEGVRELFKEHQYLISRFNIFLPPGHEISLPLADEQQRDGSALKDKPLFGDAVAFIKDVKVVFQDKRDKFDKFLKLLHDFSAKRINRRVVKEGMMELFKEHQDLISRFNTFFPPGHEISLPLDHDQQHGDGLALKDEQKDDELQGNGSALKDESALALKDEKQGDGSVLKDEQKDDELQGDGLALKDEQKDDEE